MITPARGPSPVSTPGTDQLVPSLSRPRRYESELSLLRRLSCWFSPYKAARELSDPLFWHDVFLETVLCVFANCSIVWVGLTLNKKVYEPGIVSFGLYAGFFVFVLVEGWAPVCGCCVNVARTFSVFIAGQMTPIKSLLFFIVEIAGGAAGAMLAKSCTPEKYYETFFAIVPGDGMTDTQAVFVEAILTFNFVIVTLVVTDPKLKTGSMGGLAVGFCIGTGILVAGTHTGGLQNPVIAMNYAMNAQNFEHHWIYWVGPLLGSAVGTVLYMVMAQIREKYGPQNKINEHVIDSTHDANTNQHFTISMDSFPDHDHNTHNRLMQLHEHDSTHTHFNDDEHNLKRVLH